MRLIIAEKPSLARAIADALPGGVRREDGALHAGDSVVTWCLGHLLEQAPPDAYDPAFKQWRLDHLPILPSRWQLTPRPKARGQLAVIRKLLKQAREVVHAGDPDREGQLLVQEVIEHLGWKGPVARLLVSDLNRPAVQRALARLEDNARYQPLYRAAESRARADWLYGINLTRAWTLTGRQAGHEGVLSVGRVQTPVLGLVVRRDAEIRGFVAYPFYVLWVDLAVANGPLRAWWQPGESHRLDDQGRLLERAPAEALAARLPGAEGRLTSLETRQKRQSAPLPYSLSALQVDAARRFGLSAQAVLDICQRLYERHKLITYPRSDCRYLPQEHLAQAHATLSSACGQDETLRGWLAGADFALRSKAWDDKKVGAHHALAPTGKPAALERLERAEADVFRLIARNVLAQFYPPLIAREVKAEFSILDECFRASGQELLQPGWKPLFTTREEAPPLPAMREGEPCRVQACEVEERETRPPEPFTDASLIKAMMNIARYVDDPAVKRTLREHDGLGTEATRAGIIETLIERGYLVRRHKTLRATRLGSGLIASLPEAASRPERTALWEQRLTAIAERDDDPAPFLAALVDDLRSLLGSADAGRLRQAMATAQGEATDVAKRRTAAGKSRRGRSASARTRRKPRAKA
ncbi:DNA topoisomerase III [Halomonas sp. MCCC 1A17488]|uniref:DNA topoisomerase III n=1 Tax=unclassified Halomonas TaxID=2609666 RepID=UPI0018D25D24|nr:MULTISPECIES: DNA topoisomerase III [unclassified Halomonas]MCE8015608.1 DNA topoisomerase III [Halomonas sp. MCCC 1A17488]MCG3238941.1 DNA topoisomerase III [Halomonas sp. MCCC 1A17488]QPP51106.1 DNA topoisomerase III [Halomonas sp. SS10-MC5]